MTRTEFLAVIRWTMNNLAAYCRTTSFLEIMRFKRDLQIALAAYSKHSSSVDKIQEKALAMIAKIEKWARAAFVKEEIKKLRNGQGSSHLILSAVTAKHKAYDEWEKLNRKMSY